LSKIALILEGGGLRCIFTAGILRALEENAVGFPYVVGISAGSIVGVTYLAGQTELYTQIRASAPIREDFNPRTKQMDMIAYYDRVSANMPPLDYKKFHENDALFYAGAVDVAENRMVYFEKSDMKDEGDMRRKIMASSALPGIADPVVIDGVAYYDGGMIDAIPIEKALSDGYEKLVVVLTQNANYRKTPYTLDEKTERAVRDFPDFHKTLLERHNLYNHQLDRVAELERKGSALVFRPKVPMSLGTFEAQEEKAKAAYNDGYRQAVEQMRDLKDFVKP
jgi:predicted patatin/cPLA2 family phospholipase